MPTTTEPSGPLLNSEAGDVEWVQDLEGIVLPTDSNPIIT
jgi:hypothetical protein